MNRSTLIIFQVIGGLTLVPYPVVLLANIMSISAPGSTRATSLPFLLLSLYPVAWIALWVLSWRAIAHGKIGLALSLSGIPVLACALVAGFYAFSWAAFGFRNTSAVETDRAAIEPHNPLLWKIWCMGGTLRFPPTPPVSADETLRAIDANPGQVNIAVPPYGTPLKVAVANITVGLDGAPVSGGRERQQDTFRVVRSLVAHGARFEGDEKNDLWSAIRLKMALADEPVDTAHENPLVWRILTMPRGSLFAVFPTEVKLLNKSTTLYGTPLCAALVKDAPDIYPQLLDAGAHLSDEEWRDPAVMASLNRAIAERPDLHWPHPQAK